MIVRVSGRMKVAQHFSAGYRSKMNQEPALAGDRFSRPLHGLRFQ